jgi:hypothetical protein
VLHTTGSSNIELDPLEEEIDDDFGYLRDALSI